MIYIITGPQASGKGTQAVALCDKLGLVHLSTGYVMREMVEQDNPLGRKIDEYMNKKGVLVPDEIIVDVIKSYLTVENLEKGIIFDGFPRTRRQLGIFKKILKKKDLSIDQVFYINASEKVINQRLAGRLVCKKCGENYHVTNTPPKNAGVCDRCGSEIYRRKDETPGAIGKRLAIYHEQTEPLLEAYREMGILQEINGDNASGVVLKEILKHFKGKLV